ncbi:MAG TPA: hypothetical protein VER57_05615, partial [Cyanobium sp.]|nr:hypothetical protein [Cyanobium sp.]
LSAAERIGLFEDCAALAAELALPELSMGMSGDWPEAVAAGSTWVRLGTALFGARPDSEAPAPPGVAGQGTDPATTTA